MDDLIMNDDPSMDWETRDGRVMQISHMETAHILNCPARIRREWPWRQNYVNRLLLELTLRAAGKQ